MKLMQSLLHYIFLLSFPLSVVHCHQGVLTNKDDLLFLLMQNIPETIYTLNLRFVLWGDGQDPEPEFTVTSDSTDYTVTIEDSDLKIDSIKIFPYYPDSASSLDYHIMHAGHNAGTTNETVPPMEGGPFRISDFHIYNSSILYGDGYTSDSFSLKGSFDGEYMSARIDISNMYLRGSVTGGGGPFNFEINTGQTVVYADSDCKFTFNSDHTDAKDIELSLKEILRDDTSVPPKIIINALDTVQLGGGITTVNQYSNPDIRDIFINNINNKIKEYRCLNGSYL